MRGCGLSLAHPSESKYDPVACDIAQETYELPVDLAFSQYQRKIGIAIRPVLASCARPMQNGIFQAQIGRKPAD